MGCPPKMRSLYPPMVPWNRLILWRSPSILFKFSRLLHSCILLNWKNLFLAIIPFPTSIPTFSLSSNSNYYAASSQAVGFLSFLSHFHIFSFLSAILYPPYFLQSQCLVSFLRFLFPEFLLQAFFFLIVHHLVLLFLLIMAKVSRNSFISNFFLLCFPFFDLCI